MKIGSCVISALLVALPKLLLLQTQLRLPLPKVASLLPSQRRNKSQIAIGTNRPTSVGLFFALKLTASIPFFEELQIDLR